MEFLKKKMAQKLPIVYHFNRGMKKHSGFSLIEVLIAMIILAGGLLGLAGLQATSLRNNQSAYNRSVATQLAYEMADRMRANYTEAKSNNAYFAAPPTTAVANCKTTAGCSPAEIAQNDLYEWNQAVQSSLPSGTGTIMGTGVFTITITWTENRYENGNNGTTSFLMSFEL